MKRAVGLHRTAGGVWTPAPRAGARKARFQDIGNGVHVIVDGATTGKQLTRVAGVPVLTLAE